MEYNNINTYMYVLSFIQIKMWGILKRYELMFYFVTLVHKDT